MKIFLLAALLCASPAFAKEHSVDIRLYSLHKLVSINLEPEAAEVLCGEHSLKGPARVTVRGAAVVMDGALRSGPVKILKISAQGGVWLSGPSLPRRLYTGELVFFPDKKSLKIIASVPLETYVAGVVTGEAGDLSQLEAYKAQAVAARTYTVKLMKNHIGEGYNLCDSTHCQLYSGLGAISAKAKEATEATRGELLMYKGRPASAFYHSVCGGWTENMANVWPFESKPYLISVRDGPPGRPYCSIAPGFRWKTKIYYTGLTRLSRQAGWLTNDETASGMRVAAWGAPGRAAVIEIQTQRRSVKISATNFYHGIGRRAGWQAVRSSFFNILSGGDYVMLDGLGNGHGVGMCQWGAEGMARLGFKYRDILRHYYPGTEIGYD